MEIKQLKTTEIKPYGKNAKKHPQEQVLQIADSITEFGFNQPIVIDEHNVVIVGHGRLEAAKRLGMEEVPTLTVNISDEQAKAYRLADNKLNESPWDIDLVVSELQELSLPMINLTGFGGLDLSPDPYADGEKGSLAEKFGVPPFSVLDTKQGYWVDRRREWLTITGNLSETKEGVLGSEGNMMNGINEGSSNFDPVLAELMYKWFCKKGGHILDPFGGEQTKGVVAAELGYKYSAVEYRQEQVDLNLKKTKQYTGVTYKTGDSENIGTLLGGAEYDMVFTSPPYYDLEVYSKDDMSALGTYDEFITKYQRIMTTCADMLAGNSFYVVKIGEVRDKKTGVYRNFLGDNIRIGIEAGLQYYNEIVLVNAAGTAPLRANRTFASRKLVKLHQNVLVFYKGDTKNIKANYPEIELIEDETETPST